MTDYYFCVAGFMFKVSLPPLVDVSKLLPSFMPFRCEYGDALNLLFCFTTLSVPASLRGSAVCVLEESLNDMGHIHLYSDNGGYYIEMNYTADGDRHSMQANAEFSEICASLCWTDPHVGDVLSSMLRIAFSQAILSRNAISVHAAAVCHEGKAFLFMGKSGTGKSTHAALWMKRFAGCELLNDDNPIVRVVGNEVIAYGSPWSGKTPCYRNLAFPVKGIVRLRQAPANRFMRRENVDAFITLMPGCSVIRQDERLSGCLYDTLVQISENVVVGLLECLPDEEAAQLCRDEIMKPDSVKNKTCKK